MAFVALRSDWPTFPNDVMFDRLRHAVQCRGVRVLLTGEGGDQVFSGLYHPYTELIAANRGWDVLRQVQLDVARFGVAALPSHVYWHALRPFMRRLVPARAARAARRWLPGRPLPPWIGGPFARRTGLRDRLRRPDPLSTSSSTWQALVHGRLLSGWQAFYNDVADQAAARFGFEYRHPFCDRRVVEFSMVLPLDQYWRRNDRKVVAPLALRGVIPECIRSRTTKAEFSELLAEGWATAGDRLFGDLRIGQLGWVDSARLRRLFDHTIDLYARSDSRYVGFANTLWPALAVEHWVRYGLVGNALSPSSPVVS
jgi:asparagine synthase (glutamine-hydrolysing)